MDKRREIAMWCFVVLFVALNILLAVANADGRPDEEVSIVARAIVKLRPSVESGRAFRLAEVFVRAGCGSEIDPLLLVVMGMRESAFREDVERLDLLGRLGERGLLQVHGVGLQFRPAGCTQALEGADCQIRTGARFLAFVRRLCGGTKTRWVASYGTSRCVKLREDGEPIVHRVRHSMTVLKAYWTVATGRSWRD